MKQMEKLALLKLRCELERLRGKGKFLDSDDIDMFSEMVDIMLQEEEKVSKPKPEQIDIEIAVTLSRTDKETILKDIERFSPLQLEKFWQCVAKEPDRYQAAICAITEYCFQQSCDKSHIANMRVHQA